MKNKVLSNAINKVGKLMKSYYLCRCSGFCLSQAASKVPKRSFPLSKKVKPCDNFMIMFIQRLLIILRCQPINQSMYSLSQIHMKAFEKSLFEELSTKSV